MFSLLSGLLGKGILLMNNERIKQKISILSSDKNTMRFLRANLLAGFSNEILPITTSLEALFNSTADIIVLDEQNPLKMSAIDICKIIRTKNEEIIILLLTDDFDTTTKILALEFGADDYLEKPVNRLEIIARIKVILRRMEFTKRAILGENEFEFNDLYLDSRRRICTINGNELRLTNHEFLTLLHLVQEGGKPVARASLLSDIWDLPSNDPTRPVDDVVRRLRKKLKEQKSPTHISAVWGYGYRIEVE